MSRSTPRPAGSSSSCRYSAVLATVALLLALAAAGCGKGGGPSAAEIVSQSAATTSAVKTFHLLVSFENVPTPSSGLGLTIVDGDVAVPDKLEARVGGTFHGVPLTSELIVIGQQHFLKDPFSGKWTKVAVAMTPVAFFDPTKGVLAVIKSARDIRDDGSEDVGGVACHRLKANVPASALTPLLGNTASAKLLAVELWIGKSDKLLRRVRLSGPIAAGEASSTQRTVELSAFDEPVQITAPAVSS